MFIPTVNQSIRQETSTYTDDQWLTYKLRDKANLTKIVKKTDYTKS